MKILINMLSLLFLTGCFASDNTQDKLKDKIKLGKITFIKNCAECHGKVGQGITLDWKKRQADGTFPPPPLNGTAHTWHHSPKILMNTINNGGKKFGGTMPGFKTKLSEKEKQALLDYIYSLWPQIIQKKYDTRFK